MFRRNKAATRGKIPRYPYPAAKTMMPGKAAINVPHSPQPPSYPGRSRFTPRVRNMIARHNDAHPYSVWLARALGDSYGRGINGSRGTIATGLSRNGAGPIADPSVGFAGYGQPPQIFTGWNPGAQGSVGTPLTTPGGLPGTSLSTGSPLDSAMAQIMQGTQ